MRTFKVPARAASQLGLTQELNREERDGNERVRKEVAWVRLAVEPERFPALALSRSGPKGIFHPRCTKQFRPSNPPKRDVQLRTPTLAADTLHRGVAFWQLLRIRAHIPRRARSLLHNVERRGVRSFPEQHADLLPRTRAPRFAMLSCPVFFRCSACSFCGVSVPAMPPRLPFSFPDRFPFRAPRSFRGQVGFALAIVYLVGDRRISASIFRSNRFRR